MRLCGRIAPGSGSGPFTGHQLFITLSRRARANSSAVIAFEAGADFVVAFAFAAAAFSFAALALATESARTESAMVMLCAESDCGGCSESPSCQPALAESPMAP